MRSNRNFKKFRALVRNFYRREGRHALPWRHARTPYRVVVSELMLQQTQVNRVIAFYPRFLKRFPSFGALAKSPVREVLKTWQGLGYNRRALALKHIAEKVMTDHKGKLPRDSAALEHLPGIGHATAGAILAFAFNIPVAFAETNIRRVFIHHFFPHKRKVGEEKILKLVERTLDRTNPREWYSALMDYGSWLAKETENPNRRHAAYRRQPQFKGSSRELRGTILKLALADKKISARRIAKECSVAPAKAKSTLAALRKEGFF